MRMPPLPADSIHARACKLKCEKILTRPPVPPAMPIIMVSMLPPPCFFYSITQGGGRYKPPAALSG